MPEIGAYQNGLRPRAVDRGDRDDRRLLRRQLDEGRAGHVSERAVLVGHQPHGVAGAVALLHHHVEAVLLVDALVDAEEEDGMGAVEQPVGAQCDLIGGQGATERQRSRQGRCAGRREGAAAGELVSCCLSCRVGHEQPPVSLFAFEVPLRRASAGTAALAAHAGYARLNEHLPAALAIIVADVARRRTAAAASSPISSMQSLSR